MSTFISYAQNQEDVVLWRALGSQSHGFYVDVGAGDPVHESVTKLFFDRGWRGINLEPNSASFRRLCEKRPHDVNLNLGVADTSGRLRFFEVLDHPGASTFSRRIADSLPFQDVEIREVEVEVTTLERVLDQYAPPAIDFLKVDTEGMEAEVVRGGNWRLWRPRILVLESTRPHQKVESYQSWEPVLLESGYLFALFDGVNRFYVREEDRELLTSLKSPANVLDDFTPYRFHRAIEELRLESVAKDNAYQKADGYIRHLEQHVKHLETCIREAQGAPPMVQGEKGLRFAAPVASAPKRVAEVCVVIVHHKGLELLDRCLRSLLISDKVDLQVVVVANACTECLPIEPLKDPRVHVLWCQSAMGFSEANNVGVGWVYEHVGQPEFFFFLNNDTEVERRAVASLRDVLRSNLDCGVVGPCLKILGAEDHLNSLGLNVSEIGESWDEGIGRSLRNYGPLPGRRQVLAVTGSALMIRREVLEQAGGWTEFYSYYLEDIDLCLKVRSHGWSIINEPAATVLHAVSATAGKTSDFKRRLIWRNQLLMMASHWPVRLLALILPRLLAREAASFLKRRRIGAHADARIQAQAWMGAVRQLPKAVAMRFGRGRDRHWVKLLAAAGSVPTISLPEIRDAEIQGPALDSGGAS